MKRLLFEEPFWLYVLLLLAEAALFYLWLEDRTRKRAVRLVFPVACGVVVGVMAALVTTDREKIMAAVYKIAQDASRGSLDAAESRLDEDFTAVFAGSRLDRKSALEKAEEVMRRYGLSVVELKRMEVKVSGSSARTKVHTWMSFGRTGGDRSKPTGNLAGQGVMVLWELEWVKLRGRWLISRSAEPRVGFGLVF